MAYRPFGRSVRRISLALIVGVAALSGGLRLRSYLLTRKIMAVLTSLERVRVDVTSQEELLRSVPYLKRQPNPNVYGVAITNYDDYQWVHRAIAWFPFPFSPRQFGGAPAKQKWAWMDLPARIAYVLGSRYLSFSAFVTVANGTVSQVAYEIKPDVLLGFPQGILLSARTVHGYLRTAGRPVHVDAAGDQSPDFRFGAPGGESTWLQGADPAMTVAYTPAAPPALVADAFQVNLSCFWWFRGCDSVRDVAPRLWQDRETLGAKAKRRLESARPCPDEILAGRVRTLPDLNVALVEVGPGQKFLRFGGAAFDSCQLVPATVSAEAAVRTAPRPQRRGEDYAMEARR